MHKTTPADIQSGITWCIDNGFGNSGVFVQLRHPDGRFSMYGHMSALAPGMILGATVSAGQRIGWSGNTGITTGPHLHYEERNAAGTALEPGNWVACQGDSPIEYLDLQQRVGQSVRNDGYNCASTQITPPATSASSASYASITPARLLETRPDLSTIDAMSNGIGTRTAGTITHLQVTGRAGVPTNATSAVLNITATDPQANGYLTIFPCGTPLPTASNLNFTTNQTIANNVTTKIGDNGQICIYTLATTHVIADINGYFG